MVLDPPRCIGHPYSISGSKFPPRGPEIRNGGMHGRVYEIGRVEIEEARFPLSVTYSRLLACSARLRFNEWNDDGNRSLSPHQSQLRNIRPD